MSSVHLLVLVHGMWGNPTHLKELHHEIKQKSAESGIELHTMLAETNQEDSTYDGIDWGGERVAQEIYAEIEELKKDGKQVTRFSITGYSLGGLVSRYVVGILLQKGFFDNVTPVNFNTLATPHLGLVRYPSFFSTVSSKLGPKLLSRTGEQFFASDKWSTTGRPLLDIMSDPDFVFYQALARFQTIRIYANATNDRTVPYVTAAIETEDPFAEHIFNGIEIQVDERYKPIIKSYHFPPESLLEKRKPFILTREWFDNRKKRPASLPPFLRFRFPLNILFYVAFPLLLPAVLSLAIIRFSRATRSSKARIKTLETDFPKGETLASMLGRLEHQMESAVVEMMEDPMLGASSSDNTIAIEDSGKGETTKFRRLEKDEHPVITPLQYKIAARMNKLPIKKEFAFLTDFNTHGTIICRDVERFAFREAGRGVIRHWADSLVV